MRLKVSFANISIGVCTTLAIAACTKKDQGDMPSNGTGIYPVLTDSSYTPSDPPVAATIGFFMDGWAPRTFTAPDTTVGIVPQGKATDSLTINLNKVVTKVSKYVYGNNSVLWMGQVVNQPNLMQYIKDLSPNIIRAPAGSISDIYFWNGTAARPKPTDAPDSIVIANGTKSSIAANPWYGGNTGSGTLSLNNYYSLLSQSNSMGIITVNYGYARYGTSLNPVAAAAHLAADWVRYDNGRSKYWEVGNENFGDWEASYRIDTSKNKDGQPMILTGALYGTHFKVFSDSMKAAAAQIG